MGRFLCLCSKIWAAGGLSTWSLRVSLPISVEVSGSILRWEVDPVSSTKTGRSPLRLFLCFSTLLAGPIVCKDAYDEFLIKWNLRGPVLDLETSERFWPGFLELVRTDPFGRLLVHVNFCVPTEWRCIASRLEACSLGRSSSGEVSLILGTCGISVASGTASFDRLEADGRNTGTSGDWELVTRSQHTSDLYLFCRKSMEISRVL